MNQLTQDNLLYRSQQQTLQGQVRVQSNRFLKINKLKAFLLFPFLIIISGFVLLLVLRKNKYMLSWLICSETERQQATYVLIQGNDGSYTLTQIDNQYFVYHKVKYSINDCKPVSYTIKQSQSLKNKQFLSHGLSQEQYKMSMSRYGLCEHSIEVPSLFSYLIDQLLGIFFILQYITCVIYILEQFISFACIMLACSLVTTIVNYLMLRSSFIKIKEIAQVYTNVEVVRDGRVQLISSRQLVPGDIFIPRDTIPCDCILRSGEAFLNEVNMTGQSIPIAKFPCSNISILKISTINWLFQGSILLQSKGDILALVVHTGFITKKGRIFRKILSGSQTQPQFFKYAFIFLLEVFVYCVIVFCALIPMMQYNNISTSLIVLRFFDMIGWAIPPALPIFFNVCYTVSMYRLRQQNIFGTQPFKTIVSGKVRTMCFDKTGTLTQNAMNMYSILQFSNNQNHKEIMINQNSQHADISHLMDMILGSCHSVRMINNQFMGDELDLKMFLFSQYIYQNSIDIDIKLVLRKQNTNLQILKINQFESKYQDMSVLVKQKQNYYVFIKGSPEKIHSLSFNKVNNFNNILSEISLSGLRCLGVGYKKINNPQEYLNGSREMFGDKISICGLVTFSNSLKEGTKQLISKMKQGAIEAKIITGDNVYVAVETAFKAGILEKDRSVLVLKGDEQKMEDVFRGQIIEIEKQNIKTHEVQITKEEFLNQSLVDIAVDQNFIKKHPYYNENIKVFARITPEGKASIIQRLTKLKILKWQAQPYFTRLFSRTPEKIGMCGDGANDLMAIKQADLGIGITKTDSSFASDFSIPEINSLDTVVLEGKTTLQNVIEIFQYCTGISVLKYISSMICVTDKGSFTDNMYTYLNYASTLEIVLFLAFSKSTHLMTPSIPNDNLIGLQNHLLFLISTVLQCGGLIGVQHYLIRTQSFTPVPDSYFQKWSFSSQLTTAIFLSSHLLFILRVFWIYKGYPWKKEIYSNYILIAWLIPVVIVNFAFFFITKHLKPFFGVIQLEWDVQVNVMGITLGTVAALIILKVVMNLIKLYQK